MNQNLLYRIYIIGLLFLTSISCTNNSSSKNNGNDSLLIRIDDTTETEDTHKYYVIDTTGMSRIFNEYGKVKNLLEFHTKDTMKTDTTYLATLAMGKDISSFELNKKVADIQEKGGVIKVR